MKGKKYLARKCKKVLDCAIMWCNSWDNEARPIPKDVPRGHFVVYVGEEWKRYVVQIALLKDPLFKKLLDSAEQMFGFPYHSKLYLPCKECVFVTVLQCIGSS